MSARPGERAPAARPRPWRDYWQLVPIALLAYALVAVERFRRGAQAAGLAHAVNLISGLAVAAFALAGPRGFAGLQSGSALLGVWLIIAGPILNHKHAIADSMYWSNSWVGGVLIALAAGLAAVALRGGRPAADHPDGLAS